MGQERKLKEKNMKISGILLVLERILLHKNIYHVECSAAIVQNQFKSNALDRH